MTTTFRDLRKTLKSTLGRTLFAHEKGKRIVCKSPSKMFGLTGLFLSTLVDSDWIQIQNKNKCSSDNNECDAEKRTKRKQ